MKKYCYFIVVLFIIFSGCSKKLPENKRKILSLNGSWEFTVTQNFEDIPSNFKQSILVPGVVDMASPKPDTIYRNKVYWYRKIIEIENSVNEVALLKIYKAMYHTRVYLNKKYVGENPYCFTPSVFDVKPFLNQDGTENELVIGVGCYYNMPDTVLNGFDIEKSTYVPGIYDNVEIQLAGYPLISNVQTAPLIEDSTLRVNASFITKNVHSFKLQYEVKEVSTDKIVSKGETSVKGNEIDFKISVPNCKLWSPEDPFMYELLLSTDNDDKKIKFGMRSFHFEKGKKYAILNGKPYYLRGTNIAFRRFLEDSERGTLPWNDKWVIDMFSKFKSMHWNGMRFCVGFPPERWYEIVDSIGFLIQDEYPLWMGLRNVKAPQLVNEYTEWMKERWNHPSVVIWDAQNETITEETGKAIQIVRHLDLSCRPWDNGWSPPQSETDPIEDHPYLMDYLSRQDSNSFKSPVTDIYNVVRIPHNGPSQRSPLPGGKIYPNASIINEYEWLWLNRDGSPTTLTEGVYNMAVGKNSTKEQRRDFYARTLAMSTEYWRAHRKSAAVFYFVGLSYSRPNAPLGQTCDNFVDIQNLQFEPTFEKFMKPAFAPVGLMLDIWNAKYKKSTDLQIPVFVINDTYTDFKDTIKLTLFSNSKPVKEVTCPVNIKALASDSIVIDFKLPETLGKYTLVSEIKYADEIVTSEREFEITP
jgi:beta-galactosidase